MKNIYSSIADILTLGIFHNASIVGHLPALIINCTKLYVKILLVYNLPFNWVYNSSKTFSL